MSTLWTRCLLHIGMSECLAIIHYVVLITSVDSAQAPVLVFPSGEKIGKQFFFLRIIGLKLTRGNLGTNKDEELLQTVWRLEVAEGYSVSSSLCSYLWDNECT